MVDEVDANEDIASYEVMDPPPPEVEDELTAGSDDVLFVVTARFHDGIDFEAGFANAGSVADIGVGTSAGGDDGYAGVCTVGSAEWIELDG